MSGENGLYSPRLDIAVGPFATGHLQHHATYNDLQVIGRTFLEHLHRDHARNMREIGGVQVEDLNHALALNYNARCFLGIEIENRVSRKHLMGGAINASALGRLGIAVGWTDAVVKSFVRLWKYLDFLSRVGKNSFNTSNLLIVSAEQLSAACALHQRGAV